MSGTATERVEWSGNMTHLSVEVLEDRIAPYTILARWDTLIRTYSLVGSPTEDERRYVTDALREIASVIPMHFREVPDSGPPPNQFYDAAGHPEVRIHFDQPLPYPFAGQAYAPGKTGLAGDVYFRRPLLAVVALHELMHAAVGLGHTEVPNSVMTAFVSVPDARLRPDDVAGAQFLYGAGVGSVTPLREALPPYSPFPGFAGTVITARSDVDGNGTIDTAFVAQGQHGHVKAESGGREVASFLAFPGFLGEVRVQGGSTLALVAVLPDGYHLKAYSGGAEVVSILVDR